MREGQANKSFKCLEVLGRSVGHKNALVKGMRPKLYLNIGLISIKWPVKISDLNFWIIVHAFAALVLVGWSSGRILSLDEDITGSCINVQSIWQSSNSQVDGEEIAHVVKAVMFG